MTPEIVVIVTVGVALAGLVLTAWLTTLQIMLKRFEQVDARFAQVDARMDRIEDWIDRIEDRIERLETRMSTMEQQQARIGGLLDGLREAIFDRATR